MIIIKIKIINIKMNIIIIKIKIINIKMIINTEDVDGNRQNCSTNAKMEKFFCYIFQITGILDHTDLSKIIFTLC